MAEDTGRGTDYAQIIKEITLKLQTASADALETALQSSLRQVICADGSLYCDEDVFLCEKFAGLFAERFWKNNFYNDK